MKFNWLHTEHTPNIQINIKSCCIFGFGSIEIDQFAIWYQLMPMVYCESNWFIWKLNWRFMYKYGHTIITQPIFQWSMINGWIVELFDSAKTLFCFFFSNFHSISLYNSLAACASGTHTSTQRNVQYYSIRTICNGNTFMQWTNSSWQFKMTIFVSFVWS